MLQDACQLAVVMWGALQTINGYLGTSWNHVRPLGPTWTPSAAHATHAAHARHTTHAHSTHGSTKREPHALSSHAAHAKGHAAKRAVVIISKGEGTASSKELPKNVLRIGERHSGTPSKTTHATFTHAPL
mmetsp:Transcript_148820/g.260016  ORF Transcript_148820/g.260016 Transcript_148820/m.260016 type:complete len:130 (-) Transcript_148820:317-706(-)